jgi:hypothetical protein
LKRLLLLLPALLAAAIGQNLLTNGDFEQELTVGWTFTGDGYGTHSADRSTGYEPDPDYEAMTYQYDNPGWARLGQTVDVPGPLVELQFKASFAESGGVSTCWPAACFSVCYLDADSRVLGETRYYYSTYADWVSTPTLSLYRVTNPAWRLYTLDVVSEVSNNLPGVNAADIAKIEVALYSYTYDG